MVDHIVQFGSALVLPTAASAAHGGRGALIPAIILILVLVIAMRGRSRRRRPPAATPPVRDRQHPRSARQAMSATPGRWESDTEPQDSPAEDP